MESSLSGWGDNPASCLLHDDRHKTRTDAPHFPGLKVFAFFLEQGLVFAGGVWFRD